VPARLILKIKIAKYLAGRIKNYERLTLLLDSPRRREAAWFPKRRAQPVTGIRQHTAEAHTGRDHAIDLSQGDLWLRPCSSTFALRAALDALQLQDKLQRAPRAHGSQACLGRRHSSSPQSRRLTTSRRGGKEDAREVSVGSPAHTLPLGIGGFAEM